MSDSDKEKREDIVGEGEMNPLNEDDRPKRRRLTYQRQEIGKSQAPAFLDFHLQILKSLESADQEPESVVDEDSLQNVPSNIWAMTKGFLEQRTQLSKAKKEAARWQGIHEEALTVMGATSESSISSSVLPHASVSKTPTHRQPSPTLQQHTNTSPSMSQCKKHSFSIVARLLEHRYHAVDQNFQQQTDPFQPLLTFCKNRISTLKDVMRSQQETWHDKNEKAVSELLNVYTTKTSPQPSNADQSQMAAMQSRIRLWTMLSTDLETIVSS